MNEAVTRAAFDLLRKLGEHLPQILTVVGGVAVVAGTIEVAKHAEEGKQIKEDLECELEEAKAVKAEIDEGKLPGEHFSEDEYNRDITGCYIRFVKREMKCFGVGGLLVAGGIVMMSSATGIEIKKNTELSAALATITASYTALKKNIDKYAPEEYAAAIKYSGRPVNDDEIGKKCADGTEITKNKAVARPKDVSIASPYAKFFDTGSMYFNKYDPEANRNFVFKVQSIAMDMCKTRGVLSLNDVLALLDIPQQIGFNHIGWIWGPGFTNENNPIDFNVYNFRLVGNREFINASNYDACEAPAVLLDFNVNGAI